MSTCHPCNFRNKDVNKFCCSSGAKLEIYYDPEGSVECSGCGGTVPRKKFCLDRGSRRMSSREGAQFLRFVGRVMAGQA